MPADSKSIEMPRAPRRFQAEKIFRSMLSDIRTIQSSWGKKVSKITQNVSRMFEFCETMRNVLNCNKKSDLRDSRNCHRAWHRSTEGINLSKNWQKFALKLASTCFNRRSAPIGTTRWRPLTTLKSVVPRYGTFNKFLRMWQEMQHAEVLPGDGAFRSFRSSSESFSTCLFWLLICLDMSWHHVPKVK